MGTDPRAARTRRHIREALIAMSEERGAVLTVSGVAQRAAVNRSTFYAHFDSLEQVALEILDESLATITELGWLARVADRGSEAEGPRDLLALVEHVAHRRRIYASVLTASDSSGPAQVHVAGVLSSRLEEAFLRYGATEVVDEMTVRATAVGVGAATTAMLTGWLRGELCYSEEGLAAQLASVLPEWTRLLHNDRHSPGAINDR